MQNDALSSPGLIPNAHRLRQEAVKAISYVEVQADLMAAAGGGLPSQGESLRTFFSECRSALSSLYDMDPPFFVSAAVALTSPRTLVITFDDTLDATVVPAASTFVSSPAKTFNKVVVSEKTVTLTSTTDFVAGATTIAYTQPGVNALRDLSGNGVESFTAQTVTVA